METNNKRKYLKEKGITLIALVITIVVLLILAGVSINALFGDNGIINRAKEAQNKMDQATEKDKKAMNELSNWLDSKVNETTSVEKPLITDSSLTSNDRTTKDSKTVIAQDIKGNQVVVPGKFKVSSDSGTSVQQGIVIEDQNGNQFVWIPISNIDGEGSNKIKKNDGSEVEITLGRYKFATESSGTGETGTTSKPRPSTSGPRPSTSGPRTVSNAAETETPGIKQKGIEYNSNVIIDSYYQELSDSRPSNESDGTDGTNTTAKNLREFIEKANTNKGFYIARYEASYDDGYDDTKESATEKLANAKPLSKKSTANSSSNITYNKGTLWNFISEPQAAIVSQNMYKNHNYVESDLINSYAWDTAIAYIQAMEDENYANADGGTNISLNNTGSTNDEKCKIFDMAGNAKEWTTEYSNNTGNPCTCRGGSFEDANTSARSYNVATYGTANISFRTVLTIK